MVVDDLNRNHCAPFHTRTSDISARGDSTRPADGNDISVTEQGSKEGHNHHNKPDTPKVEEKIFSDEELVALIDPILQMDDLNKDGFIDYPEFIRAQQKAQQKH